MADAQPGAGRPLVVADDPELAGVVSPNSVAVGYSVTQCSTGPDSVAAAAMGAGAPRAFGQLRIDLAGRRKLGDSPHEPRSVATVRGVGYRTETG